MRRYFVTGTDTDAGKTLITGAMLHKAKQQGLRSVGLKPVAAGCELQDGQWCNDDALTLMACMSESLSYHQVNPVALPEPIAPHIAAVKNHQHLTISVLAEQLQPGLSQPADLLLVEGAGGWLVPLNDRQYLSDLCQPLQLDVILVIGLKLGCINHALLTVQAIEQAGLKLVGWVGNQVKEMPMSEQDANLETLSKTLSAPCLGVVPYLSESDRISRCRKAANYIQLPTVN